MPTLRLRGPADESAWIAELRESADEMRGVEQLQSAVRVSIDCFFVRPKRHFFGRRPETKRLRASAPKHVDRGPATDAIGRAVLSASTACCGCAASR